MAKKGGKESEKEPQKESGINRLNVILSIIAAIVTIILFFPQVKEFIDWLKSPNYIELNGSFPNEKWLKAEESNYKWLAGEWNVHRLRRYIVAYKIENGKLYRQNKGNNLLNQGEPTSADWYLAEVHKSNSNILRLAFPKETDLPLIFIRKDDDCAYYETERHTAKDGSVESNDGMLLLNVEHTQLSNDGMIYDCK